MTAPTLIRQASRLVATIAVLTLAACADPVIGAPTSGDDAEAITEVTPRAEEPPAETPRPRPETETEPTPETEPEPTPEVETEPTPEPTAAPTGPLEDLVLWASCGMNIWATWETTEDFAMGQLDLLAEDGGWLMNQIFDQPLVFTKGLPGALHVTSWIFTTLPEYVLSLTLSDLSQVSGLRTPVEGLPPGQGLMTDAALTDDGGLTFSLPYGASPKLVQVFDEEGCLAAGATIHAYTSHPFQPAGSPFTVSFTQNLPPAENVEVIVWVAREDGAWVIERATLLTEDDASTDTYLAVGAGYGHSCGLTTEGAIQCWGDSDHGQCDAPEGTFAQLSVGWHHGCALDDAGDATCWGMNNAGQLHAPDEPLLTIVAADFHTCGLTLDHGLVCWGDVPGNDPEGLEIPMPEGTFTDLATGAALGCVITDTDAIVCWGFDNHGQASPPAGSYAQVSTGSVFACALDFAGHVSCWGRDVMEVLDVPEGTNFTAIGSNWQNSCGITDDGSLACWGRDSHGQSSPPKGTFKSISVGALHGCGVGTDDLVRCWGSDLQDQSSVP